MTHPLTPREKVAVFEPCPGCGADEPRNRCLGCSHDFAPHNRQAILDSSTVTALASGSGDHAELARLAETAEWMADGDIGAEGSVLLSASVAAEHASDLKALIAEVAALRAESENARTVVAWANNSLFGSCGYFHGEPFDGLHLARPIETLKARATEAERKLAEARSMLLRWRRHAPTEALEDLTDAWLSKEAERGLPLPPAPGAEA